MYYKFGDAISIFYKKSGWMSARSLEDRNWYEYAKSATDVDIDTSRYFQDCKRYLDILEQISS
jgi:hypothetical protein